MLRQKPGGLFGADARALLSSEADFSLQELVVTVTGLPSAGVTLRPDGLTQVAVGDRLTAAELAALSFSPALPSSSDEPTPWKGSVFYVPQNGRCLPMPLLAELPPGSSADTPVTLIELPSNGLLFLANGMTALGRGQVITAAQLCGLTYRAFDGAIGRISLLRYRSSEPVLTGEVLIVVGPNVPARSSATTDASDDNSSISPLAVALLLGTGLAAGRSASAAEPKNYVPSDPPSAPSTVAALAHQVTKRATAVANGVAPNHTILSQSTVLAQSVTTGADAAGSLGTNVSPPDQPPPHHRIGSSSPPDFGSLKMALASTTLTSPTIPIIPSPTLPPQPAPPSSTKSQDLGLFIAPASATTATAGGTITAGGTTHWTNSIGGEWNIATNWSTGVPGSTANVVLDGGSYLVTSTASVDINSLVVGLGATLLSDAGTAFTVEGSVVDDGTIKAGPFGGSQNSTVDIKGDVSGTGSFDISNRAVLEIGGSVSGQLTNGSFSGITVSFVSGYGELILDHSAQFNGLIASSSPTTPLSPTDLIDLKDLAFTSSMSTSVQYNSASNITTVNFSNGSSNVNLQFAGKDFYWNFSSDGHGGTVISDPSTTNPIVLENAKQGTPMSVWWVDPGQDSTSLEGFTTAISTNIGNTVQFKIDNLTGNPDYQIQIYRLGYYGGDGARLITTLQHTTSIVQPNPITNSATGEVDAGNWSVTDSWNIPVDAVSGVYIANVVQGSEVFQIPFIVKDPSSTSNIVFQTADETWQAYNGWGGANLYGGNGPSNPPSQPGVEPTQGAAFAVSYNRPIVTRDGVGAFAGPQDSLFGAEYSSIYWLEQNGYDVSYISGLDTATNGALLLNHKVFMDVGHDEYWTDSQVANVQAAANAGVNLVFLSGNEVFWQTQFQPSIDGSNAPGRTLVSYKDSHFEQLINPDGQGTGTFEAPVSWGGANMPSNALTGTLFSVDQTPTLGTITIPFDMTQLRFWRNTSIANTAAGQSASLENGLLGYEWDSSPDNGFMPAGLIDLSSTTLQEPTVNVQFGNVDQTGTATHNLVEYRDPTSGALVFGAGTVFWSWGLSNTHDPGPDGNQTNTDPNVQQAMVNLFADMGVQPQTLQASLVIAGASTDTTPPTSKITSVSATSVVEGGTVTVSGTATDVGGVIGGVQISTDGGKTWHVTSCQIGTATVSWTYSFNAPGPGTYTVETRAVDDSLNLETPSDGKSYTVTPSSALSLFSSSGTPAVLDVADSPVEVGVKFTSTTNGEITGIRFYKGPTNTGTHIGDLWSSTGTLLASATFTNETASGWQQVNFSTPVPITAGQTYMVSYHTNGNYADTANYFDTYSGQTNGSLTAAGEAVNGYYAYGSGSVFPNVVASSSDNYWVDVVFNDTSQDPQAKNVTGLAVAENGSLTISAATLLANVTDPEGLAVSLTGVSNPVNGTVTYNSNAQTITFTPNAGYAGLASFIYTVSDTSGASGSGQVSLNVTYPITAQSLFGTNDTPSQVNSGDAHPVELGVKFAASVSGFITGIRFYKGSANTGAHTADLWSATGTLLATATFTNETASGWQEVNFSTPVFVTAGTTYVASYHTSGDYSDTANYFANSLTNGELTAPATVNGVYAYGGSSVFPTNSFDSTNYWVDVVFDGSAKPVANPVTGFLVNENGSIAIAASALLANDTDTQGLALSLSSVGSPANGMVSYDPNAQTVTFVPSAGYTGTATFNYTIADSSGNTATSTVSLFVNDPSSESLFSLSSNPNTITVNDPSAVELGVKFTADAYGVITGLRFYKGPDNTGPHVADLWSANGTLLATATFTNETTSGWQQVNFSSPVTITPGTTYIASYHTNGDYSGDGSYFANPVTSGDLTAPSGGNGVYAYGTGSIFPTNSFNSSNYWVDVVYTKTQSPPVANNVSGLVATENNSVTISASTLLASDSDPNGQALSLTGASNPSNGTVSYDPTTQSVTFTPAANYAGAASFTYSIVDTGGQTASATASLIVNDPTTDSLFNPATAPSTVTVNDPSSVELGVKFQATENGEITGLRFYKGPQNTGTHVANLWSSTGTLLATATFSNETPSGWQQVNFTTPVAVTAGTTYVASYNTSSGEYSADPNLFATSLTNGPLTAPSSSSSGGNGVFAYGSSSLFPTNSFNSTSYGVDVVFKPQLAA